MAIGQAVVDLLEELERISLDHDETTDTDVRESLHLVLNFYFVWGRERGRLPLSFGMFSRKGDIRVSAAVRRFLDAADKSAELSSIPFGQPRLDVLQASSARTANGKLYDEFIGHRGNPLPPEPLPEQLFLEGDYDDDEES